MSEDVHSWPRLLRYGFKHRMFYASSAMLAGHACRISVLYVFMKADRLSWVVGCV